MSILSISFFIFLIALVCIYYMLPAKLRPYILLCGNIFFYLSFDCRYFLFLLFSGITAWISAILISKNTEKSIKKTILILFLILNIGLLFSVKYIPYIVEKISYLFSINNFATKWLVPIGISFYTLQVAGYVIDVYREKYTPEKNFLKFFIFVSFFPLILQGPISRYDQLALQLYNSTRKKDSTLNISKGSQLILWGLFKKLMIADYLGVVVNNFYSNNNVKYGTLTILLVIFSYSIQIFADFSGFVDISRGIGILFGIDIIDNFNHPYFSVSIKDFWQRWHISLSTWFRDYVYIPLGGNRRGFVRKYLNILIVFFISGIWHGVGIHFIIWGFLHGIFQVFGAITNNLKNNVCKKLSINQENIFYTIVKILITFLLINITWVFFRAPSVSAAINTFTSIITNIGLRLNIMSLGLDYLDWLVVAISTLILFGTSLLQYNGKVIQNSIAKLPLPVRWFIYLFGITAILIFGYYGPGYSAASFIYMNF